MDAAAAVVVKAVGEVEAVVLSGVKYVKKAQPEKKKLITNYEDNKFKKGDKKLSNFNLKMENQKYLEQKDYEKVEQQYV